MGDDLTHIFYGCLVFLNIIKAESVDFPTLPGFSFSWELWYFSGFFRFENVHFEISRYNSWQMDNLFFVC